MEALSLENLLKIVIFEPETEGHRLHFIGLIAQALHDNGVDYVLALKSGAKDTPEGKSHLRYLPSECVIVDLEEYSNIKNLGRRWKQQLSAAIEQTRPTDVFIPTADLLSHWIGLTGFPRNVRQYNVRIHALIMRGAFAYKLNHPFRDFRAKITEKLLMRTPWKSLFFLDPLVVNKLHAAYGRSASFVHHMPEPIEPFSAISRSQAREKLRLPLEGRIIACAGRMHPRKGIDKLIEAFISAERRPTDRLLLIGKQEVSISKLLLSIDPSLIENQQIIARDQFAEESSFEAIFRAADMIAVPYPQHVGSSGILLRAAKTGSSILASDWGWVGWVTNTFKLGNTVNVSNIAEFANAITRTLDQSAGVKSSSVQNSLFEYHTIQNFQAHWLRIVDSTLSGRPVLWDSMPRAAESKCFSQ